MEEEGGGKEDGSGGGHAGETYTSGSSSALTPLIGAFRSYEVCHIQSTSSFNSGSIGAIVRRPVSFIIAQA